MEEVVTEAVAMEEVEQDKVATKYHAIHTDMVAVLVDLTVATGEDQAHMVVFASYVFRLKELFEYSTKYYDEDHKA